MKPDALALAVLSVLSPPVMGADAGQSGQQIVSTYCGTCHGSGWLGAPVAGIREDWQPRLAKGFDAMFANTKRGLGQMPPMGACMECTDAELKAAIEDMLKGI